jgi:hypothetical protein
VLHHRVADTISGNFMTLPGDLARYSGKDTFLLQGPLLFLHPLCVYIWLQSCFKYILVGIDPHKDDLRVPCYSNEVRRTERTINVPPSPTSKLNFEESLLHFQLTVSPAIEIVGMPGSHHEEDEEKADEEG